MIETTGRDQAMRRIEAADRPFTDPGAKATIVPPDRRTAPRRRAGLGAATYLLCALALTVAGLLAIAHANRRYAPEMYEPGYMAAVAEAFTNGESYGVFDLNINIRKLREEQFKRLRETPSVVVLGASQWQEAHAGLIAKRGYLNAHVHRDYYEDVLGMVELMIRHDRLPKDLVITVRDRLFTPVAERTDFLWLPGIAYYQAMAGRLSLEPLKLWETYPLQRPRELLSLGMLFTNITRWHNATDWPYPTTRREHESLDLLHPDGSITWSEQHRDLFTRQRALKVALAHAEANRSKPPVIDPKGVEALDRLLAYLGVRGVRVHLAHPPFNPVYFERMKDTPYMEGLRQVEAVTRELAARHKLGLVGSFDPADLGCTAEMFIDAEHSNASCLRELLADVSSSIDLPLMPLASRSGDRSAYLEMRTRRAETASGWHSIERSSAEAAATAASSLVAPAALPAPANTSAAAHEAVPIRPDAPSAASAALRLHPEDIASAVEPATAYDPPLPAPQPPAARQPRPTKAAAQRSGPAQRRALAKASSIRPRAASVAPPLVWPGDRPGQYR